MGKLITSFLRKPRRCDGGTHHVGRGLRPAAAMLERACGRSPLVTLWRACGRPAAWAYGYGCPAVWDAGLHNPSSTRLALHTAASLGKDDREKGMEVHVNAWQVGLNRWESQMYWVRWIKITDVLDGQDYCEAWIGRPRGVLLVSLAMLQG